MWWALFRALCSTPPLLSCPRSVSLCLRPSWVRSSGQWAVSVSGCVTNQRPEMMVSEQLPSQIRCQHRPSEAANTIPPWSHLPSHPWLISFPHHPAYSQATCNLQFDESSDILQSRNKDDVLATLKYTAASHSQMITRDPPLPLKTFVQMIMLLLCRHL